VALSGQFSWHWRDMIANRKMSRKITFPRCLLWQGRRELPQSEGERHRQKKLCTTQDADFIYLFSLALIIWGVVIYRLYFNVSLVVGVLLPICVVVYQ